MNPVRKEGGFTPTSIKSWRDLLYHPWNKWRGISKRVNGVIMEYWNDGILGCVEIFLI